jgi:ergothioneine biosynthesis protein EgtB
VTQAPPRNAAQRIFERTDAEQDPRDVLLRFRSIREATEAFCQPLAIEDHIPQSMTNASPMKWHLAHTTWFWERFVLTEFEPDFAWRDPAFDHLFNSYYRRVSDPFPRPRRGLITRPTVAEVIAYRADVNQRMERILERTDEKRWDALRPLVVLGLHHEQQHQELMATDLKHLFSKNPTHPAYHELPPAAGEAKPGEVHWIAWDGGVCPIGYNGGGFCFDNETPRHEQIVAPFEIADRPITNAEYIAFMEDGGYERVELWLDLGWSRILNDGWSHPLYWSRQDGQWMQHTLHGFVPVDPEEPAVHLSYFEVDAFARWAGARLPSEAEWETAAAEAPMEGNFADTGRYHPSPAGPGDGKTLRQMFGDLWEWTSSSYGPYPGYRPLPGNVGEYNGKFMCNQYVLRGGSCATPLGHVRLTYRNFFQPESRWQFTGVRLARSAT